MDAEGRAGVVGSEWAPAHRVAGMGDAAMGGMAVTKLREPGAMHLREHVARLYPGAEIVSIEAMGPDSGATAGATTKAAGYGLPVRVVVRDGGGGRELVWRVAAANEVGHARRAERA